MTGNGFFHTRTTEKKPALTVLITSSIEVAPLITAIEARYTRTKKNVLREKGEMTRKRYCYLRPGSERQTGYLRGFVPTSRAGSTFQQMPSEEGRRECDSLAQRSKSHRWPS
jgi:hypothetical protein